MRRYLLVFVLIMSGTQLHAGILDSLSIGLGGGYNLISEDHVEFIYNINLSLEFRIK